MKQQNSWGLLFTLGLLVAPVTVFGEDTRVEDCLKEITQNKIKSSKVLATELTKALRESSSFKTQIATVQRFSACAAHEPGTDAYLVYSTADVTVQSDQLIISYKGVNDVTTEDGKSYALSGPPKSVEIKFQIFTTDKGLRIGDKTTRLILGEGLFLSKKAADDRFKFANPPPAALPR